MSQEKQDILVVSDLHYPGSPDIEQRRGDIAHILLRKTFWRLRHMNRSIDAVILLGDLLNDGDLDKSHLGELALELEHDQDVPAIVLPGNHDDPAKVTETFGDHSGLQEIGGWGFLVFHDCYDSEDVCRRSERDLGMPEQVAAARPDLPLIALQHSPLHPNIVSDYPYMPENVEKIRRSYEAAGVQLALSGHYHPGQPWHDHRGVTYCTIPALCEAPFSFGMLHLENGTINWEKLSLSIDVPGLSDCHCHTQSAYCGTDVDTSTNLELAGTLGVGTQAVTEHAFQLYFPAEESWSWDWQSDLKRVRRAWTSDRHEMDNFIALTRELQQEGTPVGLELDLLADGRLLLARADQPRFDFFIGAVHSITDRDVDPGNPTRVEKLFMRDTERVLDNPIDVLAHPFRFFDRIGLKKPEHLFEDVADLLDEYGVAAEINFHGNQPPAEFVENCLERDVPLAIGTDSHNLAEVGELWPHLGLLRSVGLREEDLPNVLWTPPPPGEKSTGL
ncbi:MAG: metallophosphoesterase [Planctomycetota bacterium]